jgi:hypothetical protein
MTRARAFHRNELWAPFVVLRILEGGIIMRNYSREDIINLVEQQDVRFIRLQFTDIFGILKNVAITPGQLAKALDNECHV